MKEGRWGGLPTEGRKGLGGEGGRGKMALWGEFINAEKLRPKLRIIRAKGGVS